MNKPAPERHFIRRWVDQFEATGSVLKVKSAGKPRQSNERMNAVMEAFNNSLKRLIRRASLDFNIPKSSVHDILHK